MQDESDIDIFNINNDELPHSDEDNDVDTWADFEGTNNVNLPAFLQSNGHRHSLLKDVK